MEENKILIGPVMTTLNSAEFEVRIKHDEIEFKGAPVRINDSTWTCLGIISHTIDSFGDSWCRVLCVPFER